jgi:hypothetical protein
MSAWRDVVDWVGGYPFEVAKPEEFFACTIAAALYWKAYEPKAATWAVTNSSSRNQFERIAPNHSDDGAWLR